MRLRSWANFALVALVPALACGDNGPSAPCPRPPGFLVPAAETIPVGGFGTFAIPANQQTSNRRLQWAATPTTIATILSNSGSVATHSVGTASITVLDLNSQQNCPDIWAASLVVR